MEMKDRINQLMKNQHMTQQTFADFIGISTASLSSIFNGRTKPTLNTVEAIRGKFPTISLDWLMYGIGKMFTEKSIDESNQLSSDVSSSASTDLFSNIDNTIVDNTSIENNVPITNRSVKTEVKYIDKPQRKITEIRIFFDDQTWETFVPKK